MVLESLWKIKRPQVYRFNFELSILSHWWYIYPYASTTQSGLLWLLYNSSQIQKCESSKCALLFWNHFGYSGFIVFPYTFLDKFVSFSNSACWDFDRDYTGSIDQFREQRLRSSVDFHSWTWNISLLFSVSQQGFIIFNVQTLQFFCQIYS